MTRFDELSALASKKRDRFNEVQRELQAFAHRLVVGFRSYLGDAVGMAVYCHNVNRDHRILDGTFAFPNRLCFCADGYFYFELGIKFFASNAPPTGARVDEDWVYSMSVLIGIEKTAAGYTIRIPDKDYIVTEERIETEFYEPFFNQIRAALASPSTSQPKSPFGFGTFATKKEHIPSA